MLKNRRNLTAATRSRRKRPGTNINFVLLKNVCDAEADIVDFLKESDFFKETVRKNSILFTDTEGAAPFPLRNV